MKRFSQVIAGILCIVFFVSLFGCLTVKVKDPHHDHDHKVEEHHDKKPDHR